VVLVDSACDDLTQGSTFGSFIVYCFTFLHNFIIDVLGFHLNNFISRFTLD
jgi:hypothetical protein